VASNPNIRKGTALKEIHFSKGVKIATGLRVGIKHTMFFRVFLYYEKTLMPLQQP
jgi:hypothetical protein